MEKKVYDGKRIVAKEIQVNEHMTGDAARVEREVSLASCIRVCMCKWNRVFINFLHLE